VHSGAKGTIISRGVDEPEALSTAGALSGSRHALFLDFEVEGAALVLRARITALEPSLPIVYAKTLSTSTSSAALLRTADRLKSAAETRQEYLDALQGRSLYLVPVRIGVRSYAGGSAQSIAIPPFLWLQVGAEAPLTQARAWTGSLSLGVSWMPQLHVGWMVQGRISRLLSGSVTSLTRPDLYAFVGGSVVSIHGLSALVFQDQVLNLEDVTSQLLGVDPQALFGAVQLGLELRIKNRIGASVFVESLPSMNTAPSIGRYVDLGPIQLHSLGVEVSFCF
jgi:hypothetical protein